MRRRLVFPLMVALMAFPVPTMAGDVVTPVAQAVCINVSHSDPQQWVTIDGGGCTLRELQNMQVIVNYTDGGDQVFLAFAHDETTSEAWLILIFVAAGVAAGVEAGVDLAKGTADLAIYCALNPPTFPVRTWDERCDVPNEALA